jgi:hypothetical protein
LALIVRVSTASNPAMTVSSWNDLVNNNHGAWLKQDSFRMTTYLEAFNSFAPNRFAFMEIPE